MKYAFIILQAGALIALLLDFFKVIHNQYIPVVAYSIIGVGLVYMIYATHKTRKKRV
jgi:uncharacterized membrane protein YdcZ (DUF606 family)